MALLGDSMTTGTTEERLDPRRGREIAPLHCLEADATVLVQREDDSRGCGATEDPQVPHRPDDDLGEHGRVKGAARCARRLPPPLTRSAPSEGEKLRARGSGMGSRDRDALPPHAARSA